MELPQRKGDDRFLPAGTYRRLESDLRSRKDMGEVRTLIVSAFDRSTRLLPFFFWDWYMVPCGPRSIAGTLHEVGLTRTRFVFQLWNPRIRPSRAELDEAPIDMLLLSSMQIHSAAAYDLIEDAWKMGESRPLIITGGPKACFEPVDFFGLGASGDVGADAVVTGEESVLLSLLAVLAEFGGGPGRMREAFNRAREAGALAEIPGLVYAEDGRYDGKNLVNTGVQRLLRDLDDLPLPSAGFRALEAPHGRETLSGRPAPLGAFGKRLIVSLLVTRGCKFHCDYCPIPAYNQRSFRRKSASRMVEEFIDCRREMNARYFFGADDNFFNSRRQAEEMLVAMASAEFRGRRLGRQIRFGTESTVIDLYKNRDLLPLARPGSAGVFGIWLGVEDLSARLVDKGQKPGMTETLFDQMLANGICPMVMLMHAEDQPMHTPGRLGGLMEQIRFLRDAGAVMLQLTNAGPAFGSKLINEAFTKGLLFKRVGGREVTDSQWDGNYVISSRRSDPWRIQFDVVRGYCSFYNPMNLIRTALVKDKNTRAKRAFYQLWGMVGTARTAWRLKGHAWRLWRGDIERVTGWPERLRRPGSPYPDLIASKSLV